MQHGDQLREQFRRIFEHWGIELPPESMEPGVVWIIVKGGWTIWTVFGFEDGTEYLDCYAMHRMTNDRHNQLYPDRASKGLPAMLEWFSYSEGATQEEIDQAEAKYYAYNQSVAKMLDEKGFYMSDDAHASARVQRYLRTTPQEERQA